MMDGITLFDCTVREAGYQTGWFFDETFLCDYYRFAEAAGFDYMELGFFHNPEADPGCIRKNKKYPETQRNARYSASALSGPPKKRF